MKENKKKKSSLEEFEIFKNEKEKPLLKWVFWGNAIFLMANILVQFILEEIFELSIINWHNFLPLWFGNIVTFTILFILWKKEFKIWLIKYIFVILGCLLLALWIYFSDPEYTRSLPGGFILIVAVAGGLFHDFKIVILSTITACILYGLILVHYFNIGIEFSMYDVYLNYLFFFCAGLLTYVVVKRSKLYVTELLQKRKELEHEKASLKIKVEARTKELKGLADSLDKKVQERTKELQEKVNQLQRFQKLTIGRELKMVELKKKIKELEEFKNH